THQVHRGEGNSGNEGISSSSYASILNDKINKLKAIVLQTCCMDILLARGSLFLLSRTTKRYGTSSRNGPWLIHLGLWRASESTKAYDDRPANGNGEASTSQLNTNKVASDPLPDRTVTNELPSSILDSDSEEVEEVFVEKDLSIRPMDGVFDDAQKRVEAPPKKTHKKTGGILRKWSMRMPIARRVDGLSYGYWQFL
nr:hypothetical protein [Tanacetum cinerariifolium]